MSDLLKERYAVREPGLNISVPDIISHRDFTDRLRSNQINKVVFEMILMYTGEVAMFRYDDERGYVKSAYILASDN